MSNLTPTQVRLVNALSTLGGCAVSLWQLTTELQIDYSNAHAQMRELERGGIVLISRDRTRRGCPLVMHLAPIGGQP